MESFGLFDLLKSLSLFNQQSSPSPQEKTTPPPPSEKASPTTIPKIEDPPFEKTTPNACLEFMNRHDELSRRRKRK